MTSLGFQSCKNGEGDASSSEIENTDIVPSGTYTGEAIKVDPEEQEVYLKTDDDKTLELYFTDQTKLSKDGETVAFNTLSEGQTLQVEVEKKGKRLDPISVEIVE
ncbi:hypothetical protein C7S20_00910 [Christiangramia fulva]|uniref:Uncharacterized protein n=1 Tax=Christiangramia fulva TaxID=2126553 RepID=A0A2R3ZAM3_9FLAO|nr:hypothetical protein C7S20_00910 [Christiangramia fulva]